jgi:integrase
MTPDDVCSAYADTGVKLNVGAASIPISGSNPVRMEIPDSDLAGGREAGTVPVVQTLVRVGNVPTFCEPKTRAGRRVVAIDPETVEALRSHRALHDAERAAFGVGWRRSELVFTNPDGSPVNPDLFSGWFEQHVRRLVLSKLRLHGLRHAHVTVALKAAIPAKVVAERLGHANIRVTLQTYSLVSQGMQEEAAVKVAALIPRSQANGRWKTLRRSEGGGG